MLADSKPCLWADDLTDPLTEGQRHKCVVFLR